MGTFKLSVTNQTGFEAAFALKRGTREFGDALMGALNAWAGCPHTLTFDKKALRMPYFQIIELIGTIAAGAAPCCDLGWPGLESAGYPASLTRSQLQVSE